MIKHFRIQNFKILRDVRMEPSSVNVLVGPNGCGKSSVLQAIDFLRAFFMSSIEVYLQKEGWEYKDIPNVSAGSKTIRWEVSIQLSADKEGRGEGQYDYSVTLSPRRYLAIGNEELGYTPPDGKRTLLLKRSGRRGVIYDSLRERLYPFLVPNLLSSAIYAFAAPFQRGERFAEMRNFRTWIQGIQYFSVFNPNALRAADRGKHATLGPHGEHLAPVLANFKKRRPQEFQKLVSRLRRSFPTLLGISFSGRGWGWRSIKTYERKGPREIALNNQQIGDGLLRLLALSSFLYLDEIPRVILFEEPENGVHPHILREMVQVLKELTLRKGQKSQVFFTTHSPYVLDEFYDNPEQVFLMNYADGKSNVQLRKLTETEDLEKVKNAFGSLGEAWFSDAIGGNPPGLNF